MEKIVDNSKMKELQRNEVLKHFLKGWSMTQVQAARLFGCYRLAAVVHYWRGQGQPIKTQMIRVRTRYGFAHVARYYIQSHQPPKSPERGNQAEIFPK